MAADAPDVVLDKTVGVYVGVIYPIRKLIARSRYRELSVVQLADQQVGAFHFAAPRDRATLICHLDCHLARLPDTTMSQSCARWITQGGTSTMTLQLSGDEHAMLVSLPSLWYAADPDYIPCTFDDTGGGLLGIFPKYQNLLSRTLGAQFERIAVHDWADAPDKAASGEVDISFDMSDQDVRLAGFTLTQPIDATPLVIVGRSDALTATALSELSGKAVALPTSDTPTTILHHNVLRIRLMSTGSVDNVLSMVASGEADFTTANLPVADALICHHFPGKLKVTGSVDTVGSIGMDVSARYTMLIPFINRALFAMPKGEQVSIRSKWLSVSYQLDPSAPAVFSRFGPVATPVLAALVTLFIKQM